MIITFVYMMFIVAKKTDSQKCLKYKNATFGTLKVFQRTKTKPRPNASFSKDVYYIPTLVHKAIL